MEKQRDHNPASSTYLDARPSEPQPHSWVLPHKGWTVHTYMSCTSALCWGAEQADAQ